MNQRFGRADLHVHTTASDGTSSVADVVRAAQRAGLQVLAITDHDTIKGAQEAQRMAAEYGLEIIVGEEVSTAQGHLLAWFVQHHIAPGRSLAATIDEVHQQGGLCALAHPFGLFVSSAGDWTRADRRGAWAVDAIETFNASLLPLGMNGHAAHVAARSGMAAVGGSDSHHAATVGYGYTVFPGCTAADLRAAILARQTAAAGHYWGARGTAEYLVRQARIDVAAFRARVAALPRGL